MTGVDRITRLIAHRCPELAPAEIAALTGSDEETIGEIAERIEDVLADSGDAAGQDRGSSMIVDITGDGPIQIAIQRAFDVLGHEGAIGVVGHLETQPDDAISVLRFLEKVEQRRKRSVASVPWPARREPTTASAWKTMIRRKRKRIAAGLRG